MEQMSFFDTGRNVTPLADRLRPEEFSAFAGQEHLIGEGKILRKLIENDNITSMIFWGPPGVGKTTLAGIIAAKTHSQFINFSAVTSGIKEIKEVMAQAEETRKLGMKTENPSFEINAALLSRCKVFVLKQLTTDDIFKLLTRALKDKKGFGMLNVDIEDELVRAIALFSNGDARTALNTLEMAINNGELTKEKTIVTREIVEQCTGKKALLYDKNGEEHYNLISALHKSMRNSDPDAAMYWLARMLEAGEEPLYIARRVIRFASEDVGLADIQALPLAVAAYQACHFLGMPECNVNLAEAVTYMALAPKSNAMEVGYYKARDDAAKTFSEPVPLHIRNAPTSLMAELDYGKGYQYAHNYEDKITKMKCLPESLSDRHYYEPYGMGAEKEFKEKLEEIRRYREE